MLFVALRFFFFKEGKKSNGEGRKEERRGKDRKQERSKEKKKKRKEGPREIFKTLKMNYI